MWSRRVRKWGEGLVRLLEKFHVILRISVIAESATKSIKALCQIGIKAHEHQV